MAITVSSNTHIVDTVAKFRVIIDDDDDGVCVCMCGHHILINFVALGIKPTLLNAKQVLNIELYFKS